MWSKHTVFDLEMKGTVLPGAVALLGNFEIDAAGIIFDSTLGKPSVCTRKKKKSKQASYGGGSKAMLSGHYSIS